jgi:large subunit ribosomal protein L17
MRHRKTTAKLSRSRDQRRTLLKNLAASVVLHEKVTTTEAKAKIIRPYVERLITKSRNDSLTTRRYLIEHLPTNNSVKKLIEVLGPRYKDRSGGYTRITKIPRRQGDAAKMAVIELVK